MVDAAVERLVDGVLADVPTQLRDACDRAGILSGLHSIGACSLALLGSVLNEDYAEVKAAVAGSSKPAFVAMLKVAMLRRRCGMTARARRTRGMTRPRHRQGCVRLPNLLSQRRHSWS
mmetsp:Transcript_15929/g.34592  ORF Transcript_15929/g.34592 Transcript_15929/m.34592 type:complete len:118 (-) Transcript_15929:573-926(-)